MWELIIGIGSWIAGLFSTALAATVEFLLWAVTALEATTVGLWNVIKSVLDLARTGLIKVWDFFAPIYDDVLKPAWQKFWGWFDSFRSWLNDTFGPVLQFLRDLRTELLDFWAKYIRPWLDLIDITRKIAGALAALGVPLAQALDNMLGDLEQKIEAPFLWLLGKLNDVINVVNLVVTADGLLQRVALIRSLVRDYQYAWQAIVQPYSQSVDDGTRGDLKTAITARSLGDVETDFRSCLNGSDSKLCQAASAAAGVLRGHLGGS